MEDVPHNLLKYHSSACIMMGEDDPILHWEALLILPVEYDETLQFSHEDDQGYVKTLLCAKTMIYWPGLGKDVEHPIAAC